MMRRICCSLLLTIAAVFGQEEGCFRTIAAVQTVMETELARISNGAIPADSYTFVLCPSTFFDTSEAPLRPVLDKSLFMCGNDGSVRNRCVFVGGDAQVEITDSSPPYVLQQVDIVGMTFSGFEANAFMTGTSIRAAASSTTTATFQNCAWEDFTSDFVVLQRAEQSFFGPMTVQIEDSTVSMGSAGVIFDNDGGLLRLRNVQMNGVIAAALIASANNAASFLERATIESSDVNSITYTTAGATQSVVATKVTRMNRMDDAFYVEQTGSTLLLESVTLEQNKVQPDPWSGVSVRMGAIARIRHSSISDNNAVEFGVVAFGSTVYISDTSISRNEGSKEESVTSSPVFAITDAEVNLERVELNDNTGFAGVVITLIRSTINIQRSCFRGGAADFIVFVANDSSHTVEENFIGNAISFRCETTGPRLFVEQPGSGCFQGSNECDGSCLELATEGSCLSLDVPTFSPTTQAPDSPITSPTMVMDTMVPSSTRQITPSLVPLNSHSGMPLTIPTTITKSPSHSPSVDSPTTVIPARIPTYIPTLQTPHPTISPQPTTSPTISSAPSISLQPTYWPSMSASYHPGAVAEDRDRGKGSSSSKKAESSTKKKAMMGKMYNMKGMMMMTSEENSGNDASESEKLGKGGSKKQEADDESKSNEKTRGKGAQNRIKRAFQQAVASNVTFTEKKDRSNSTESGFEPSERAR